MFNISITGQALRGNDCCIEMQQTEVSQWQLIPAAVRAGARECGVNAYRNPEATSSPPGDTGMLLLSSSELLNETAAS